ncbi:MAG: response regulator transcription factor [Synergistaceae bacterium]|nr:response regulator transcription factor [Synergistaceae bacterium]MBP9626944.1 response regulator transcription factor [Synergistaceae bacterium]MBP9958094.1 response regulator transcription factor [Synergistaceae bacterium]
MTIRIVLADDHPLTRKGVAACIAEEEGMQLVGEAADGDSAWNLIQQFQPDIALLDIRMPGQDGIELARRIKDSGTPTKAIMLTSFDAQQYVLAALAAGAKGFIVKSSVAVELTQCIERVMNGGVYLDSNIDATLGHDTSEETAQELSPREREVLLNVSKGFAVKEVAERLHITERTVHAHLTSVYSKLGVRNKTEALIISLKAGTILLYELLEGDLPS